MYLSLPLIRALLDMSYREWSRRGEGKLFYIPNVGRAAKFMVDCR